MQTSYLRVSNRTRKRGAYNGRKHKEIKRDY